MQSLHLKQILKPGARVLVVGLGKSGVSAVKFLLELGVTVSVSEGGRAAELHGDVVQWLREKGVNMEIGGHSSEFFCNAEAILVSPGIPLSLPVFNEARKLQIPIFGEMALAPEFLQSPVVAVTGTNGKSTVTSLIGDICRADGKEVFVGGNIGVPLTDYLAGPQNADVVVLEVSSFQLDSAGEFRPKVSVLLNISPDHLDRYESYETYAHSKLNIIRKQGLDDVAVLNADDPEIMERLKEIPIRARQLLFSSRSRPRSGAYLENDTVIMAGVGKGHEFGLESYSLSGTMLCGIPNGLNAMAAALAARAIGCKESSIERSIQEFSLLPHRLSLVAEHGGVRFYDDSKATNEGSAASAVSGFDSPVVLIAGGRDKGGDYSTLLSAVTGRVKAMILLGEASEKMAKVFQKVTRIEQVKDMTEAVSRSMEIAERGDVVLLSPACASFDMFQSYAHRGDVFKQAVLAALDRGATLMDSGRVECRACVV